MLVALVGDTAFAMAKARDDRHYLVTAWRIRRPMQEWRRDDFYGYSGELADEAAFRTRVLENAEHQREKRALGRHEICSRASTPWGASQGTTVYAEGVTAYSTAGHGGFKLSAERNRNVHPMLRSAGGWYEEDAAWAVVAITFPHLFTAFERRCAERTIKDSWPDAWEAIFGTILRPGESHEKDRRSFEREHADHWVVASAITSNHEPGFVEVVATLGGKRGPGTEERRFLVPSGEYSIGRFGFVVDEARHRLYGGALRLHRMEVTMPWGLIAKAFGWRTATDEDGETPLLVVWHPQLRRHFVGSDAWRRAVRVSVRAPEPYLADADRKEVRP